MKICRYGDKHIIPGPSGSFILRKWGLWHQVTRSARRFSNDVGSNLNSLICHSILHLGKMETGNISLIGNSFIVLFLWGFSELCSWEEVWANQSGWDSCNKDHLPMCFWEQKVLIPNMSCIWSLGMLNVWIKTS